MYIEFYAQDSFDFFKATIRSKESEGIFCSDLNLYSAFTETKDTQTMKTNQMAELRQ